MAILIIFSLTALTVIGQETFHIRPRKIFEQYADINLGAIIAISEFNGNCTMTTASTHSLAYVEAIVFAVNKINKDKSILPNIDLGFVIVDDCDNITIAVAQALRFLPPSFELYKRKGNDSLDVAGIVSWEHHEQSMVVSYVLGAANVPQISFAMSSDALLSQPWFMGIVPQVEVQSKAIVEFIARQGWSYISVIYSADSYGKMIFENIIMYSQLRQICVGKSHILQKNMNISGYINIISNLHRLYERARVIVLVATENEINRIFQAVYALNQTRNFIWIGTDTWATKANREFENSTMGSFFTTFYIPNVKEFNKHMNELKPSTSLNPWLNQSWELLLNCSLKAGTCNPRLSLIDISNFSRRDNAAYGIDAIYTYAHALDRMIKVKCSSGSSSGTSVTLSGRRTKSDTLKCVKRLMKGEFLLPYLKNVSFQGFTGRVEYGESGNRFGYYTMKQKTPRYPLQGIPVTNFDFDINGSYVVTDINNITWDFVNPPVNPFGTNVLLPKPFYTVVDKNIPISVCSRLCNPGEIRVSVINPCCWQCETCSSNEKVVDSSHCKQCPKYKMADESTNFTTCIDIKPTFLIFSSPFAIGFVCFASFGIISTLFLLSVYFYRPETDVKVKEASIRLFNFSEIGAISVGYVSVILLMAPYPSYGICAAAYILFSLSFTGLYAPLLVSTVWIFRWHKYSHQGRPVFQVVVAGILFVFQIVICIFIIIIYPLAKKSYSTSKEKVYFYCDFTTYGLVSFIVYNLTLLCICFAITLLIRKLDTKLKMPHYIFMCVFTMMVIWVVLILSFTAGNKFRIIFLSTFLLLNHSVALGFLFFLPLRNVIVQRYSKRKISRERDEIRSSDLL